MTQRSTLRGLALSFFALGLVAAPIRAEDAAPAPAYDGQGLFRMACAVCHGPSGQGGQLGPSLASSAMAARSDREIAGRIMDGNMQKGMPAFGRGLLRGEIQAVVDYLRVLQNKTAEGKGKSEAVCPIPPGGDAAKGEALFRGKADCAKCHSVSYEGGMIGPDLTHIAERMTAGDIYESIASPSKRILSLYKVKELVTKDGKAIRGRFRNDARGYIQILSEDGMIWRAFFKADLQSIKDSPESIMPEGILGKLSESERTDLMAFLGSLK